MQHVELNKVAPYMSPLSFLATSFTCVHVQLVGDETASPSID